MNGIFIKVIDIMAMNYLNNTTKKHMNIKQNKINNKILIIEKILLVALLLSVIFFMVLWILMIENI